MYGKIVISRKAPKNLRVERLRIVGRFQKASMTKLNRHLKSKVLIL